MIDSIFTITIFIFTFKYKMGCGRSNTNDAHVTIENLTPYSPTDYDHLETPPQDVNMAHETTVYYNPLYSNPPIVSQHSSLFMKYSKDHINGIISSSTHKLDSRFDDVSESLRAEQSEPISEISISSLEGSVAEIKPAKMNELDLSKKSLIELNQSPLPEIMKMKVSNQKLNIGNSKILRPRLDDISQLREDIKKNKTENSKNQVMNSVHVPNTMNKHMDNWIRSKVKLPPIISNYKINVFDGRNRFQDLHEMMDKLTASILPKETNERISEDTQQLIHDIIKDHANL